MDSRIVTAAAVFLITSTAISPLFAEPRHLRISDDGSVTEVSGPKAKANRGKKDKGSYTSPPTDDGSLSDSSGSAGTATPDNSALSTGSLPPLDLSDMALWNWSGQWHASQWDNDFSTIPWRYDRVVQESGADTRFVLDATGAPELKAQKGHPASRAGLYEVDVTLPQMRSGLCTAPLWLYNDSSRDEVDFEFVGDNYLQMTIHSYRTGSHRTQEFRMAGDFSDRRIRLGIRTDLDAGVIEMFVDGQKVHTFKDDGAAFPTTALRPVISMWAGDKASWAKSWLGAWSPLGSGENLAMTVHGYRYTPG